MSLSEVSVSSVVESGLLAAVSGAASASVGRRQAGNQAERGGSGQELAPSQIDLARGDLGRRDVGRTSDQHEVYPPSRHYRQRYDQEQRPVTVLTQM